MARLQDDLWIRQGHPIRVEWMGWYSDTLRLSRAGWQMATQDNYFDDSMGVILRHPQGLVGRGRMGGYRRLRDVMLQDFRYGVEAMNHAVIHIEFMSHEKNLRIVSSAEPFQAMQWRDMEPVETSINMREWRMDELTLFRQIAAPVEKELIVAPEDVQRTLDLILKAQEPGMRDIRARDRRREREQGQEVRQVHAQIITLKAA
jgi:hypothetical protein